MKKVTDYLLMAAIVVAGIYFLYQKGYIFADYQSLSPQEAYRMIRQNDGNTTLLDVRTLQEYNNDGHLSKSILIPVQILEQKIDLLSKHRQKKIIIYCRSGDRSVTAARLLNERGFHVYNLDGGINKWKREHLPVEKIQLGVPRR